MRKVGIIRCEKNMDKCPLTNCIRCLREGKEAFSIHDDCSLTGIFACHCPGDKAVDLAKILKAKGAETIHFCTCTFAGKSDGRWVRETGGFCEDIDAIIDKVNAETGLTCVKGTAHLPAGYEVQRWTAQEEAPASQDG